MANTFVKNSLSLLLSGALLTPAFAQSTNPCVVATQIDLSETESSRISKGTTVVRRIVDYRTNEVHTVASAFTATGYGAGAGTSISSSKFHTLDADVVRALEAARPAQCKLK